ncbi:MAG: thiamine-phosphate kinase [Alphaproteobacteria bacterium]
MARAQRSSEFALIRRCFAPLAAANPGALGLVDDAAVIVPPPGRDLIATTDTIVEGVHFPVGEPPGFVARRLMRVNLSDLAAKGARPEGYLLNTAWAPETDDAWIETFAAALGEEQARWGIVLAGGDTVATPGPLTLTLTALGSVPAGGALLRGDARPGDLVYVSGPIGDGLFGLWAVQGHDLPGADEADRAALAEAFRLPEPRLALGRLLAGDDPAGGGRRIARGCADISDGLLADLGHVCEASGVGAVLQASTVPLSPAARRIVARRPDLLAEALAGGDDYELVFTARPEDADAVEAAGRAAGAPVAAIGRIVAGTGVDLLDSAGCSLPVGRRGFSHG